MSFSDDILMAYADGELDLPTRAEVEAAMAADPRIAARVAAHRALRNTVRSELDKVLDETVPERLVAAARTTSRAPAGQGEVIPLPPKRGRTPALRHWAWPQWGAIAASFVLGALVLHFGIDRQPSGPITERDGQLVASGALDRALSNQLASEQSSTAPVQIGLSFRSKDGSYCRTFQLRGNTDLAGLACREQEKWRLNVLARSEPSGNANSTFRPAGSALPPSIIQAAEQAIDGEPLDATAEAHARKDEWRTSQQPPTPGPK